MKTFKQVWEQSRTVNLQNTDCSSRHEWAAKEYARIKCEEQRYLCNTHALLDLGEERGTVASYTAEDDLRYEFGICPDSASIINAPAPELK